MTDKAGHTTKFMLQCPLCPTRITSGQSLVECNHTHAPVSLSWMWLSESDLLAFYTGSTYHEEQYRTNCGQNCSGLYPDAKIAAMARWRVIGSILGDGKKRRVLDVGAGNMAAVDVARGIGHEAYGIDPHPLRADCRSGTWEDVTGPFDVITMFDVLEHLYDPNRALAHLGDCLAPRGVLVAEMPELNAPSSSWIRHQKPREHLCLYSKEGAEALYDSNGLVPVFFYRPLMGDLGKMSHMLIRREI